MYFIIYFIGESRVWFYFLLCVVFYTDFFNGVTAPPPPSPLCASSATKGEKKMKAGKKTRTDFLPEDLRQKKTRLKALHWISPQKEREICFDPTPQGKYEWGEASPPITTATTTTTPTFLRPDGRAAGKNKTRWTLVVQFSFPPRFFGGGGGVTGHLWTYLLRFHSFCLSVQDGKKKK